VILQYLIINFFASSINCLFDIAFYGFYANMSNHTSLIHCGKVETACGWLGGIADLKE